MRGGYPGSAVKVFYPAFVGTMNESFVLYTQHWYPRPADKVGHPQLLLFDRLFRLRLFGAE
jgi:hypothetical protein